ncbi:DNA-binding domain-containing protein [Bacillus sp. WLY-B-L8]|uniref:DNA-binding domain-containing protein n=1 Tax=Bacillus multifaciens TaxID=3068506 RepID=UPI002740E864|nr:DNA-binding domain-containing protein [Bacillus sp. WLY-B-L8]MDP7980733.1 DNA-binding domain-containing protein [Bacillus sp. WLY-B-L8]
MAQDSAVLVLKKLQELLKKKDKIKNMEEEFEKIAKKFHVRFEEVLDLYNKMFLFQMDVEKFGGFEVYEQSDIAWLKSELALLQEVYQFCQQNGMNILEISDCISKEKLQLFFKTPSQLQNTYYKLRKEEIGLENIKKQKPGRKRKTTFIKQLHFNKEEYKKEVKIKEESPKIDNNLVTLLSGIVNNFQLIDEKDEQNATGLYRFMDGIYKLSSMAAEYVQDAQDIAGFRKEITALYSETERLRREKEELVADMREMTNHMIRFITSSDVEQIRTLPYFVHMCKQDLYKLGLYSGITEGQLKVMIDHSGQVVSVVK